MAKIFQRLNRGMNSDVALSEQPEGTYRSAVNMDLSSQGSENILNQIRSALLMGTLTISASGADARSMNILGFCKCFAKISGTEVEGIFVAVVSMTATNVKKSWLLFFDGSTFTVIGDPGLADQLDFPLEGVVGCFSTKDRGRSFVYFSDGEQPIRKIEMDSAVWSTYSNINDISLVSLYPSGGEVSFDSIVPNGSLVSGTYQFSYSLYNSVNGSATKWSVFTNPIPVIPEQSPVLGGAVGQTTAYAIKLNVTISASEEDDYTDIRIAVVKNNTGDKEQQTVAFVFTEGITTDGVVDIIYTGTEPEYELAIGEIVIPDAPVESVKTLVETNNRLLAGGVTYFDRRILDDEGLLSDAEVLVDTVDYQTEDDCANKKGYFRDEVYRFGIAYHDIFGNWSPVRPLDFSEFRWSNIISADVTPLISVNTAWDSVSGLVVYNCTNTGPVMTFGDTVRINVASSAAPNYKYGRYYSGGNTGSTITLHFDEDPGTPTFSDPFLFRCIGDSGSSSNSTDFKFPKRDSRLYSILDGSNLPQALGIELTITDHPSWATGIGIFRMERDRNILYQTPIIPAVNRRGILTPGKRSDLPPDMIRVDGIGQHDHLAPKILKLGAARGLAYDAVSGSGLPLSIERVFFNSIYVNASADLAGMVNRSEDWPIVFAPALDFVYNFNGSPLVDLPQEGKYKLNPVDMLAFRNKWSETDSAALTSRGYTCDVNGLHFYSYPTADFNWKIQSSPLSTTFIGSPFKKIEQTSVGDFIDFANFNSEAIYPVLLAGETITLPEIVYSKYDYNGQSNKAIRINDGVNLSKQQLLSTTSIPTAQAATWTGDVVQQRMLAMRTTVRYKDPLYITTASYVGSTTNSFSKEVYWPLFLTDPPSFDPALSKMMPALIDDVGMLQSIRPATSLSVSPSERDTNHLDVTQVALLVNIEDNKTDFRYGGNNQAQEYTFTGAYAPISATSTPVTLEVWGGDCFISKAVFKVNQGFCYPIPYAPITPQAGSDLNVWSGSGNVTKTGSNGSYSDFIECWIEADANAFYTSDRNRYPYKNQSPPIESDLSATFFYDYNFGYSIENLPQKLFSEDRSVPFIQGYPARLIYSDPRVYNSTVDGFSRFRALNFYDLDERYGPVNSLILMNDNETISFQDQAIRYLPIGKTEIQDTDGNVLTVQSGAFISEVEKYLTTFYGSQSLYGAVATDMGVFCIDSRNGAIIRIGDSIDNITSKRLDKYMADNFFTGGRYRESNIAMCYDERNKEIHLIAAILEDQSTDDVFRWIVYNIDNDSFVTAYEWTQTSAYRYKYRPRFLMSINGSQYLLHGSPTTAGGFGLFRIAGSKWREGTGYLNVIPGTTAVDANIEYVINAGVDETKVFDITGANSAKAFSKYKVTAYNESYTTETTGESTANINQRDGQTYAPQIRDSASGRLRGVMATVKLWFNNTTAPIGIYSVFNVIRKILRQ